MDSSAFNAARHPRLELQRFERLVERSERLRARRLPFDELRELSRLYRRHSARLSRLRDRAADPDAIRHLNGLCVRAYAFLYSAASPPPERRTRDLGAPSVFARTSGALLLAWLLLGLGAGIGGALASRDPAALYALLPTGFGYTPERIDRLWSSPEARADFVARQETPVGRNLLFGSQLFAHNTRVGILAFATGMLAGIPTVLLQLYNGMMLGAFTGLFLRDPLPLDFAAWLLPHAIPELTAITLCCAAGLILGSAIAAPGRRPRRVALRENSLLAMLLVAISVPLFFLAALTESFVRESAIENGPRFALAGVYAVALVAAHLWLHRYSRRRAIDTSWLEEVERGAPQASA